ncbi:MAG: adenosine kinase [Alphaproteobacteria bacterium]|nr:adenosine kinase [Alphaproteobacteria bacterium]
MNSGSIDVVGIGNAIVDVLARATPEFLIRHDLSHGSMTLIDGPRADSLYAAMGPGVEVSGGSAANTMAGIASLGGRAAYIGKVKDDHLGKVFRHDLRAAGVVFDTIPADGGASTARCLIFVTPDAQRTMATFLGASVALGPGDVDASLIARAQVTYLEGYLWDPPRAKEAFRKAIAIAHDAGRQVALSLSDAFCVNRYRAEFRELVSKDIDILFANESELLALYEARDFDSALQQVRRDGTTAALTRSAKGSVVVRDHEVHVIDAATRGPVVDTTGAGDLYAAGFLYGLTKGRDLRTCGRLGSLAAGEVISHFGARPETSLAMLAAALSP